MLVDFLVDRFLKINAFKLCVKSFPDCKDVSSKMTTDIIKCDVIHSVLVKGGSAKKDGHGTIYV